MRNMRPGEKVPKKGSVIVSLANGRASPRPGRPWGGRSSSLSGSEATNDLQHRQNTSQDQGILRQTGQLRNRIAEQSGGGRDGLSERP